MLKKDFNSEAELDGMDHSTVLAFVSYQRPEDDRSLGQEAFMRKCPSCRLPFNVRSISQDFKVEKTNRKIKYLFFLCPECVDEGNTISEVELKDKFYKALKNVELSDKPNEWAVTTDIAVLTHGGDEVAAIIYGCHLSDQTIEKYDQGLIDLGLYILGGL